MRSLDDQMLRHLSRASNLFSKLSFADISESREKQTPRHTRFVGCGLFFPHHIASVFDLFSSNPEQLLKDSSFSKSFTTESMSRTKQEVSSAYCVRFNITLSLVHKLTITHRPQFQSNTKN